MTLKGPVTSQISIFRLYRSRSRSQLGSNGKLRPFFCDMPDLPERLIFRRLARSAEQTEPNCEWHQQMSEDQVQKVYRAAYGVDWGSLLFMPHIGDPKNISEGEQNA